jgi:hypothetical protein
MITIARVARHEAGHAVVALARGCIVEWSYASVDGGKTRIGVPENLKEVWNVAAISMAGALADGHEMPPGDAHRVAALRLSTDDLALIESRTLALVELYAPAIEAVAAGLRARGQLSGLAIRRAALRASPELRRIVIPLPRKGMQAPPVDRAATPLPLSH